MLQQDILGVVQADSFLGARQGVLIEPGDTASVVQMKIAKAIGTGADGKNGVGFLVLPIERADDDNACIPGGPLNLTIEIEWVENVLVNNSPVGTGYPIRVYAAATEKLLKLYTPVGLAQNLVPARPVISEFSDQEASTPTRIGRVSFTALEADFKPFFRVNRPQIVATGGVTAGPFPNSYQLTGPATVAVSAPDADTIFYTTDGSHPYERNPAAQPYTNPVAISAACLFRARAFAAGKAASDTAAANFWA